jgi:hypothetical protein
LRVHVTPNLFTEALELKEAGLNFWASRRTRHLLAFLLAEDFQGAFYNLLRSMISASGEAFSQETFTVCCQFDVHRDHREPCNDDPLLSLRTPENKLD